MKFNTIALSIFMLFISSNLFAHVGGHGHPSKVWTISNVETVAEFVKYEKEKVYLMNVEHELKAYDLSFFL